LGGAPRKGVAFGGHPPSHWDCPQEIMVWVKQDAHLGRNDTRAERAHLRGEIFGPAGSSGPPGANMTDRYTKAVLTVIAIALVAGVFKQPSAQALNGACGHRDNPCYVATSVLTTLSVRVGN